MCLVDVCCVSNVYMYTLFMLCTIYLPMYICVYADAVELTLSYLYTEK